MLAHLISCVAWEMKWLFRDTLIMFFKIKLAVQRHAKKLGRVPKSELTVVSSSFIGLRLHFLFRVNTTIFVLSAVIDSSLINHVVDGFTGSVSDHVQVITFC